MKIEQDIIPRHGQWNDNILARFKKEFSLK